MTLDDMTSPKARRSIEIRHSQSDKEDAQYIVDREQGQVRKYLGQSKDPEVVYITTPTSCTCKRSAVGGKLCKHSLWISEPLKSKPFDPAFVGMVMQKAGTTNPGQLTVSEIKTNRQGKVEHLIIESDDSAIAGLDMTGIVYFNNVEALVTIKGPEIPF